jgi:hypothetical protein
MAPPSVMSNSRTRKRDRAKVQAGKVDKEGGAKSIKVRVSQTNDGKADAAVRARTASPVNAFLRSWAWKREPL